jgi:hypothetical protein
VVDAVLVVVAVVLGMLVAVVNVIDMATVGHGLMSAIGTVLVFGDRVLCRCGCLCLCCHGVLLEKDLQPV